ncbi:MULTISPECIES: thiopeptide-type bacteriocin biosynthesis protein [Weeksellaceae]|uniref:Thiopeptide-type bacteriocin biosynthesis protein n=1 Tax=Elizabethkingia miricola TaxID=172045 RepID=A0ABD5B8B0_ELIMR|nr:MULTISPECIES: thiopeptide-type bacteriocin biosynthesis protein [Weeksellaceae]AVF49564.1 lantibiotic dehydratase [Elizabethkingia anophelis]AVF50186.1 lantibiotic dehydratase [Elizabethkingia anophelis]MDQ8749965.1 thiopeptide-type bacteriocin biosynthesis protein [Elizabethkingia miricola]MDV4035720.1 lantibiotic dehydratase [Elizabethkingia anophelis]
MIVERSFIPGNEWLYIKLYTGLKTADNILEEVILPLSQYFQENDFILRWFFIRYIDPKPHLRIRFHLKKQEYYPFIFNSINQALQPYFYSGEIANIQLDTYNREIERYGGGTIEYAECLFHRNSELILNCLHFNDEEKIIVILFYIDQLLSQIGLSINQKLQWIKDYDASFKEEFNADKNLNRQLDKKYRTFYPKFLEFTQSLESKEFRDLVMENLTFSKTTLQNILNVYNQNSVSTSLQYFIQCIFHMSINRLFTSQQRLFEMVIYDYLYRYYKTKFYLNSSNPSNNN